MGQAKRRKAEIEQLKKSGDRIFVTAVHEAGHAVARFLTHQLMGIEPADAVTAIDMRDPATETPQPALDGKLYVIGATTYGPMFSKEINEITIDGLAAVTGMTMDHLQKAIAAARAAGVTDAAVDQWVLAKIMIAVGGPVAEAKAFRKLAKDLLESLECKADLHDAVLPGVLAGWTSDKIDAIIARAVGVLEEKFSDPITWNGLLVLARALPRTGTFDGRQAWETYKGAVEQPGQVIELTGA